MPSKIQDLYKRFQPIAALKQAISRGGNAMERLSNLPGSQRVRRFFEPTEQVRTRDFIRELPGAAKTIAKTFYQEPAQYTTSLIQRPVLGQDVFTPQTKFEKFFLRDEPIKSAETSYFAQKARERGVSEGKAANIGRFAVVGGLLAEVTGVGKAKGAAKAFSLANDAKMVEKVAAKAKIKLTPELTDFLVKEKNPEKIATTLAEYLTTKAVKAIPKELEPLANQATGAKVGKTGATNQTTSAGSKIQPELSPQSLVYPPVATPMQRQVSQPQGLLPSKPSIPLLSMGRPISSTEAKKILKRIGEVVSFKDVLKPGNKVRIFGEKGGEAKILTVRNLTPNERQIKVKIKNISDSDPDKIKDITALDASFKDVFRNFQKVFGENFAKVKRRVLDPLDAAKTRWIDEQEALAKSLKTNIVEGLGIKLKSKESALVQRFGEGKISLEELKKTTPKWENIVKADEWFRKEYDRLLNEVNAVRAQIYPNNPAKIIPKRKDYYRHFQELDGMEGLSNILTGQANIPAELAGVSARTSPKSKFLSFAQRRLGDKTDEDAVGGFLNYIKGASYAKHIDPQIGNFRKLREEIIEIGKAAGDEKMASRFSQYLDDFANNLAGKTNPLDRSFQDMFGRMPFRVIDWLNKRVKANVILGNLSSSIAQAGNAPQIYAHVGAKNFIMGITDTMLGINKPNKAISQSSFIRERYMKDIANEFDHSILNNTKKLAVWTTQALDELFTKAGWNSFYRQAQEKGISNASKYADDMIREMVAGRGVGELPLAQSSRVMQLIAPFQIEVQNLWHVLGKNISNKEFGKIVKFALAAYVFNQGAQRLRGSGVTFDPIDAVIDAAQTYHDEDDKNIGALRAGGRLAGEVLSNVMFGQTLAALYPERGIKFGEENITRKELFGEEDPTRFGSGLLASRGLTNPLYNILPPFGGAQIKRTVEGIGAYRRGHSETKGGQVRFPIEKDLISALKSGLFGQYSTRDAQEYFSRDGRPLSEQQSEIFRAGGSREFYDQVIVNRQQEAAAKKELKALKSGKQAKTGLFGKKPTTPTVRDGIVELSNGKFAYQVGDEWKTANDRDTAKLELAKDAFKKSGKNFQEFGDYVFRRNEDGSIKTQRKTAYEIENGEAKLTNLYNKGDFKSWLETAEKQAQRIIKEMEADYTDETEYLKLENKLHSLMSKYEKYSSYGGFTKPKKGRKAPKLSGVRKPSTSKPTFAKSKAIRAKVKAPKFASISPSKRAAIAFRSPVRKPSASRRAMGGGRSRIRIMGSAKGLV